jgi:hypothetical protein
LLARSSCSVDDVRMAIPGIDEEWELLQSLLPADWRELAKSTKAMRRARGAIDTPDKLLQLLLLHVAPGLSLHQAVARARADGLVSLSKIALHKRLQTSGEWLRALGEQMFRDSSFAWRASRVSAGRRLLAVDATSVVRPGSAGSDLRIHYVIGLPDLRCAHFELTSDSAAECFERMPVQQGDLILADRGYSRREGVAYVVDSGADVVMRLHSRSFPLLDLQSGTQIDLLKALQASPTHEPRQWQVRFRARGRLYDARLCAIRKSEQATELTRKKIRQRAVRSGRAVLPATLEFAAYVMVLTTTKQEELTAAEVLELYRARWQVELCFKRFKSLLDLDELTKVTDTSALAWVQGKLLTALLVEALAVKARCFSPWGHDLAAPQRVA